jgi:anaphase-promoting complex subunit 1
MANTNIVTIRGYSTAEHDLSSRDPPSIYAWIEQALAPGFSFNFPSLGALLSSSKDLQIDCAHFFPRTTAISKYLVALRACDLPSEKQVEAIVEAGISRRMLDTLPEAVRTIMNDAITRCQANPPTTWSKTLLRLVGREDLVLLSDVQRPGPQDSLSNIVSIAYKSMNLCPRPEANRAAELACTHQT